MTPPRLQVRSRWPAGRAAEEGRRAVDIRKPGASMDQPGASQGAMVSAVTNTLSQVPGAVTASVSLRTVASSASGRTCRVT